MNPLPLKPALLWLLLLWQTGGPVADPSTHFRYRRGVDLPRRAPGAAEAAQACAVLDADIFAHAAASLKDLRLYGGAAELPYVTTLSEPLQQESEDARILNLRAQSGGQSGHILFDLEMPRRPYTALTLDLAAQDYVATATVSGSGQASGGKSTRLGTFTLFDLTTQRLSRSTDIPLSESTFPYLHVDLALSPSAGGASTASSLALPAIVRAASVPPGREAQSIYTTVQSEMSLTREGEESVATLTVQARVPVERIAFTLPNGFKGGFSRAVRIEARGVAETGSTAKEAAGQGGAPFKSEDVTGSIFRVHMSEAGRELSAEKLSIPVSIGSNMQQPAMVKVMVENGSDPPLPFAAVELQMRQRRICFDARSAAAPLTLYYGDPSLDAPTYNAGALSAAAANPRTAVLEAERVNSDVVSALPPRRASPPRPVLRWIALLGCVCVFALLVIRRGHRGRY